jgi:RimJ/RimL family protein N-acetyltransferase
MTYRIHDYPAELIDVVYLTGGDRVVIRPVLPQDRELLVTFFLELSAEDRCSRFLHPVSELSPALLKQFTQIDYASHIALVAETFDGGDETVIGEARYVRAAELSSVEIAVSVAGSWRGKGIARLMLAKLECHAATADVCRIIGYTLDSNERTLSLARKVGFVMSQGVRGVIRLEKALTPRDNSRCCATFASQAE